jgi:hypothetical protein
MLSMSHLNGLLSALCCSDSLHVLVEVCSCRQHPGDPAAADGDGSAIAAARLAVSAAVAAAEAATDDTVAVQAAVVAFLDGPAPPFDKMNKFAIET